MKYVPAVLLAAVAVKVLIVTITLPAALIMGFLAGLYAFHLYTQAIDPSKILGEVEKSLLKHQEDIISVRADLTHLKSQLDSLKLNTMFGKK